MADRRQQPRRIDIVEPCFVRMKVAGDSAWYGGRIFTALGMLHAECNGAACDPLQVWHGGNFVSEAEYRTLMATANTSKPF